MRVKAFGELTHDDLLGLTDEQVDFYIDLACAEAGVRLLPPAMPDATAPDVKNTFWMACGVRFLVREEAEQVAALASRFRRVTMEYMHGSNYSRQHARPASEPEAVTEVREIDQHLYETHRLRLDQHAAEMGAYGEAREEYDRICRERATVHGRIRERREAARTLERRRRHIRAELERYLELAGYVYQTALNFLEAAYPDARDACPDVFLPTCTQAPVRAGRVRGVTTDEPAVPQSDAPHEDNAVTDEEEVLL